MFPSKCKTEFKNKTYSLSESQHSWYINWIKFLCNLSLASKRLRDMGIFYTSIAACLAQRWVGLTFMSCRDYCSKRSTITVWMHMYTLCTLVVWTYVFTKIQKMKRHPWNIRQKPVLLHKAPALLLVLWSCLRGVNKAFAHGVGFCMNAEIKVVHFVGSNSSREKSLSCGQTQQSNFYHFSL